jgi:hypothetical protein
MTTMNLDGMIQDAMAVGIRHLLIPRESAILMNARLEEITSAATTTTDQHTPDGCLMCAVRALTEGEPRTWWPGEPASVEGVVLQYGKTTSQFAPMGETIPYVDLWLGHMDRIRIKAYSATLRTALTKAAPQVGDTLTVTFEGHREITSGKLRGQKYRHHTVTVERGHH